MLSLRPIPFEGDVQALLAALPASAGVGQILGAERRSLTIGAPANLRKWAASNLGAGPPPAKGKRPRTNLAPVTAAVAYEVTTSAFRQRLVFERLMAQYVPLESRRDLKPPVFLHLDLEERFPRLTLRRAEEGLANCYGPFRDRRAAEKASAALHKLVPLRPCDFDFEPDAALPLGLSCLYAQVRSCAAPCLVRISGDGYRELARFAERLLARPQDRTAEAAAILASSVAPAEGGGIVIATGKEGTELYPVVAGSVHDAAAVAVTGDAVEKAVRSLRFEPSPTGGADWPWLSSWLASPRGRDSYLAIDPHESPDALARRVRDRL